MKEYDKNQMSVELIIKETYEELRILKNQISPSGTWDCYCYVYANNELVGNSSTNGIDGKVHRAYKIANPYIKIEVICRPGMAPSLTPRMSPRF